MQEILYKMGETIMNNVTIEMVFKFIIIYFFIIWISLIIWVIKDITIRTNNIFFQILSVLIIVFWTPFWIFIYLLIRPRKSLYDKYYECLKEDIDSIYQLIEDNKNQKPEIFKKKIIQKKLDDKTKKDLDKEKTSDEFNNELSNSDNLINKEIN